MEMAARLYRVDDGAGEAARKNMLERAVKAVSGRESNNGVHVTL